MVVNKYHAGLGTMPCEELLTAIPCIEGRRTQRPTINSLGSREEEGVSDDEKVLPSEGVYVVPPVPQKLAELIRRGGYVEMGELLPEFWSAPNEEAKKEEKGRRTRKVRDIFTWLECFASYVAVRVSMTTRADGIPVHDCEGEPGFRGFGLGKVRCSLQEAGSTNGKHPMVSDKLHPLHHVLYRSGYKHEAV